MELKFKIIKSLREEDSLEPYFIKYKLPYWYCPFWMTVKHMNGWSVIEYITKFESLDSAEECCVNIFNSHEPKRLKVVKEFAKTYKTR